MTRVQNQLSNDAQNQSEGGRIDWDGLPLVLRLWPDTARILGVGRHLVYQLARQAPPDGLPVIRLGRNLRVPRDGLRAWIDRKAAGEFVAEQPAAIEPYRKSEGRDGHR
jgi:hypothetical protein